MLKKLPGGIEPVRFVNILLISLSALGLSLSAYADRATPSTTAPHTAKNSDALPPGYMTCPKISEIHKNPKKRTWGNKHGWKSYDASFSEHIDSFLGAQWQGVRVGNVVCLYKPKEGLTFPIVLHYSRLTYEPAGKGWGKNLGGYVNCKSHHQKDCLFKPEPKPKSANIYDEAGSLKGQAPQQLGF